MITKEPDIISGYTKAVLTPNGGEFPRLYEKVVRLAHLGSYFHLFLSLPLSPTQQFGKEVQGSSIEESEEETKHLAAEMGGITILRKGAVDIISNGTKGKKSCHGPPVCYYSLCHISDSMYRDRLSKALWGAR